MASDDGVVGYMLVLPGGYQIVIARSGVTLDESGDRSAFYFDFEANPWLLLLLLLLFSLVVSKCGI